MRGVSRKEALFNQREKSVSGTLIPIDAKRTSQLKRGDERLSDFVAIDLDVDAIVEWANCPGRETRRNRILFVEALPILVPMLVWKPDNPFSLRIIEWIDSGEPLAKNIAELMGDVAEDSIQFLIGKPLSLLSGQWIDDELGLVFALSCIPADKRPQSKADWEIFADFQKILLPVPWDASGQFFGKLCCMGYEAARAEMLALAGDELHKLRLVNDFINFLSVWADTVANQSRKPGSKIVPFSLKPRPYCPDDPRPENEWVNRFFSGLPATAIFCHVLAWRSAFQDAVAVAQRESNDPELIQWPALLRQPYVSHNARVTSLTTIEDAIAEGRALKHYMDNYIESCTLGDNHLVAIKDAQGAHISTAEIHLVVAEGNLVFPYNLAHHRPNGEYAHLLEEDILNSVLEWLRLPDQQPWLQALVRFHGARHESICERLKVLERLDFETMCQVLRLVIDNYEEALSEVCNMGISGQFSPSRI